MILDTELGLNLHSNYVVSEDIDWTVRRDKFLLIQSRA